MAVTVSTVSGLFPFLFPFVSLLVSGLVSLLVGQSPVSLLVGHCVRLVFLVSSFVSGLVSPLVGHCVRFVSILFSIVSLLVSLLVGHCVRALSLFCFVLSLSPLLLVIVSALSPFCLPLSPVLSPFVLVTVSVLSPFCSLLSPLCRSCLQHSEKYVFVCKQLQLCPYQSSRWALHQMQSVVCQTLKTGHTGGDGFWKVSNSGQASSSGEGSLTVLCQEKGEGSCIFFCKEIRYICAGQTGSRVKGQIQ